MRVKRGIKARRRRNKVLERASGYYGANSRLFSVAKKRMIVLLFMLTAIDVLKNVSSDSYGRKELMLRLV